MSKDFSVENISYSMNRGKIKGERVFEIVHYTVFLPRGSCIYSEKSYGMSQGSYYKIFIILRWVELEFSKINVFRAF